MDRGEYQAEVDLIVYSAIKEGVKIFRNLTLFFLAIAVTMIWLILPGLLLDRFTSIPDREIVLWVAPWAICWVVIGAITGVVYEEARRKLKKLRKAQKAEESQDPVRIDVKVQPPRPGRRS